MTDWERHFRSMSRSKPTPAKPPVSFGADDFGLSLSQTDDMDAINVYMMATQAVTTKAIALKDQWVKWWNGLGTFGIYESDNYDTARNMRNAFNLANATTPAQVAQVQATMKTGVSAEQAQGLVDRRDSQGNLPVNPPPAIPLEYKIAGAVLLALIVLKKVALL